MVVGMCKGKPVRRSAAIFMDRSSRRSSLLGPEMHGCACRVTPGALVEEKDSRGRGLEGRGVVLVVSGNLVGGGGGRGAGAGSDARRCCEGTARRENLVLDWTAKA